MNSIKKIVNIPLVILLCFSLTLSGCSSLDGSSDVDPELTKSTSAKFFSNSGWQACAFGMSIGGVGCALFGGSVEECLISAAVGCGVAMGGNYYLDSQRAKYANKEQRLDSYINDVRENTAQVQAVTEAATGVLERNQKTLAKINQDIKQNRLDQQSAQQELAKIDANIAYLNEKLVKMKTAEKEWRQIAGKEAMSGMDVSKLDLQIVQLNKQIVALEKQINLVTQQRSAVRIS